MSESHPFRRFLPLIGLILFIAAIWVLSNEIQQFSWQRLKNHFIELPNRNIAIAFGFTVLNYLILTGYDTLAMRYFEDRTPYRKIALASFVGYSISHNITPSLITGGSARYRLYSAWGVSGFRVTNLVAFNAFSLWIGFMAIGGLIFLSLPVGVPPELDLPVANTRPIGWLFLGGTVAYLCMSIFIRKPLYIRSKTFEFPHLKVAIGQVLVASADLITSACVLYFLLPVSESLTMPLFLGIYILAFMSGIVSQIPGGLGVFETVIVLLLGPFFDSATVLSSVIAYRVFYYLLPLLCGAGLMVLFEAREKHKQMQARQEEQNNRSTEEPVEDKQESEPK